MLSVGAFRAANVWTLKSRLENAQAQASLAQTEALEKAAIARAAQVTQAKALLQLSRESGFFHRNWDMRRFNMRQVSISREALNTLMAEISRSPDRYFAADQFEVSVKRQDDSLFITPAQPGSELLLTLKGTLLFRARKEQG